MEYGQIAKTLHLLRVVDPVDDIYRRQMNRQFTVQESRHKLARDGVATRYDKSPESFEAGLHLRGSIMWLKHLTSTT